MMPMACILSNSALAIANLSGGRRRVRACTGGPFVAMKCSTSCLVDGWENFGTVMSGNSASSLPYGSVATEMASKCGAASTALRKGVEW